MPQAFLIRKTNLFLSVCGKQSQLIANRTGLGHSQLVSNRAGLGHSQLASNRVGLGRREDDFLSRIQP